MTHKILLPALALIALLAGCIGPTGTPPVNPDQTPSSPPSETLQAATDTPTPPFDQTLLWIPEGADPAIADTVRTTIRELASGRGMDTGEYANLTTTDMKPYRRYVIALQPADAVSLAANYPGSRYLLITNEDVQPTENLYIVRLPELEQAFLAGYTAAMAADQWKTGMLSRPDTPSGPALRDAFVRGVQYLCGNCAPRYDPKLPLNYPVYAEATPDTWSAGLESLKAQGVLAVYIDPSLETGEIRAAVGEAGMHLVTGLPAPEDYEGPGGLLIARILLDLDPALRSVYADLTNGNPGRLAVPSLAIQEVNPNLLSEARQRLVEETRQLLEEGWISPSPAVEHPEPTPG